MISIHAPREGSDAWLWGDVNGITISIHAPREGSDSALYYHVTLVLRISIHAPREGSDPLVGSKNLQLSAFQSTLPVRGATRPFHTADRLCWISIHAPREGSDSCKYTYAGVYCSQFQSTLPVRGATKDDMQTWQM